MFLDGNWYRLTAKQGSYPADDPVRSLDVAILQENLLAPVLGIGDPRSDENIDFVGGIRGLEELEKRVGTGEWWVVDQGSANGTYVNSLKIAETTLKNGQELRFGALSFRVDMQGDPDATVAPVARPSSVEPTRTSCGARRSVKAPSVSPAAVSDGRSFAECTARSARPSSTARWTSLTNTP